MRRHVIVSRMSGKVYKIQRMRTADSFNLPVYHKRRVGDTGWQAMHGVATLAAAKVLLNG